MTIETKGPADQIVARQALLAENDDMLDRLYAAERHLTAAAEALGDNFSDIQTGISALMGRVTNSIGTVQSSTSYNQSEIERLQREARDSMSLFDRIGGPTLRQGDNEMSDKRPLAAKRRAAPEKPAPGAHVRYR